jgi:hypothetical protein
MVLGHHSIQESLISSHSLSLSYPLIRFILSLVSSSRHFPFPKWLIFLVSPVGNKFHCFPTQVTAVQNISVNSIISSLKTLKEGDSQEWSLFEHVPSFNSNFFLLWFFQKHLTEKESEGVVWHQSSFSVVFVLLFSLCHRFRYDREREREREKERV